MTRKPVFNWDKVSLEDQTRVVDAFADDGHSVYDATGMLEDMLIPRSVADHFAEKQVSDGTFKGTTWNEFGEPIEPVGIYGLDVLRSLAAHHGLSSAAMGRGFAARDLTRQLRAKLHHLWDLAALGLPGKA